MISVVTFAALVVVCQGYHQTRIQLSDVEDWQWSGPHGPSNWSAIYPDWGLDHQSPLNVPFETTNSCVQPLQFIGLLDAQPYATLQNGYRSAVLFTDPNYPVWVHGGGLPADHLYHICGIYFSVGANDSSGSSNQLFNIKYPLEVMIVLATQPLADENDDAETSALAVLSFVVTITYDENPAWRTIVAALDSVEEGGSETDVNIASIGSLLPQYADWTTNYLSYTGTLPWPTCAQGVTWIIYPTAIPLSRQQVAAFRRIKDENGRAIVDNHRGVSDSLEIRQILSTLPPPVVVSYTGY